MNEEFEKWKAENIEGYRPEIDSELVVTMYTLESLWQAATLAERTRCAEVARGETLQRGHCSDAYEDGFSCAQEAIAKAIEEG
jgi:hypothetical protein